MKTLSGIKFKGKRVLVRSELNSEVVNGRVLYSDRIKEAAVTLKELKKKKARVVVLAHQGRPNEDSFTSLKQHSKLLNKFLKVKFVGDVIGRKAVSEIKKLKDGEVLLLDNIRGLEDEFKPGRNIIVRTLAPLFDFYVNDAFSSSHRNHTSIVSFPKYLKSFIGRTMENELKALRKLKLGNCLYILAGAKPEDNIKLLGKNKVLSCGLFGQICLIAKGKNLGAQNKYLKKKLFIVPKLKSRLKKVETPVDFAVKVEGERKELGLEEFPSKYEIFDIGRKTIESYIGEIKKFDSVLMKGTAGYCEDRRFCKGTISLLRAVSKVRGLSILAGGHLDSARRRSGISKSRFSYVSLSGGALVSYLAGEKLPGLEALK